MGEKKWRKKISFEMLVKGKKKTKQKE